MPTVVPMRAEVSQSRRSPASAPADVYLLMAAAQMHDEDRLTSSPAPAQPQPTEPRANGR